MNDTLPHLIVAPITSNMSREYIFDVVIFAGNCGLKETSRVQLNYMRGINRTRCGKYIGTIPKDKMIEIDDKIKTHLGIEDKQKI